MPSAVSPFADFLFKDFEVIHPVFDGDEAEIREVSRRESSKLRRRADLLRIRQRVLAAAQTA